MIAYSITACLAHENSPARLCFTKAALYLGEINQGEKGWQTPISSDAPSSDC